MARLSVLLLVLVLSSATAMQAQAPTPKPDPEMKKAHVTVGQWRYEGEAKPGPFGPSGKFTGEQGVRMILGGFFIETRVTGKNPMGEFQELEIDGYDPVHRNFTASLYDKGGDTFSGTFTVSGNTWTWTFKSLVAAKQHLMRGTDTYAVDSMSFTRKAETSVDGKTWTPFFEARYSKVQPAPKK